MCLIIQIIKAMISNGEKTIGYSLNLLVKSIITKAITNSASANIKFRLSVATIINYYSSLLNPLPVYQQIALLSFHKKYIQGQFAIQGQNHRRPGILRRAS